MASLSIGQRLTLQETETQVKPASARKKSNWLVEVDCPGIDTVSVFQVWLYPGAQSRLLSICFLCHTTVLCGLYSPKESAEHRQSSFGYISICLAMPGERGPLPEFPTNVLRLTSHLQTHPYGQGHMSMQASKRLAKKRLGTGKTRPPKAKYDRATRSREMGQPTQGPI